MGPFVGTISRTVYDSPGTDSGTISRTVYDSPGTDSGTISRTVYDSPGTDSHKETVAGPSQVSRKGPRTEAYRPGDGTLEPRRTLVCTFWGRRGGRYERPNRLCDPLHDGVDVGERRNRRRQEGALRKRPRETRFEIVFANLRQRRREQFAEDLELQVPLLAGLVRLCERGARAEDERRDSESLAEMDLLPGRSVRRRLGPRADGRIDGRLRRQPARGRAEEAEEALCDDAALFRRTHLDSKLKRGPFWKCEVKSRNNSARQGNAKSRPLSSIALQRASRSDIVRRGTGSQGPLSRNLATLIEACQRVTATPCRRVLATATLPRGLLQRVSPGPLRQRPLPQGALSRFLCTGTSGTLFRRAESEGLVGESSSPGFCKDPATGPEMTGPRDDRHLVKVPLVKVRRTKVKKGRRVPGSASKGRPVARTLP
ncbi:hypothetical protein M885DRAFT_140646 [Pelagophyceae sp. CCMP2097]|nr:hypothetical protein M885DRAFT_140646 [Pelagophyceae sp. CCMP2097]